MMISTFTYSVLKMSVIILLKLWFNYLIHGYIRVLWISSAEGEKWTTPSAGEVEIATKDENFEQDHDYPDPPTRRQFDHG